MADQILIDHRYAYSRVVDLENMYDARGVLMKGGLRVYRDTPHTIHVQVRTTTTKQGRISGLSLTRKQALEVAAYLTRKAKELSDE